MNKETLSAAERSFLALVETTQHHRDSTTWGQLAIRHHAGEGPQYECRHVDDRGTTRENLDQLDGPTALRERTRFDNSGCYRPLKTAPNLPTGWYLAPSDSTRLIEAISVVYPASIENWYLERQGELDITHWREAVARQTGRYGDLDTIDPSTLTTLVRTHCTDDSCLKRRQWELDGEHGIDVPGDDGVFPCREPCPYFLEAAKQFQDGAIEAGEQFKPE